MMDIQIIIPVCNPDVKFLQLLDMLQKQCVSNLSVLIIDSGCQHEWVEALAGRDGFVVERIPNREFNHGGTRLMGMAMFPHKDVYVFLTQDAILTDEYSLERLIRCFADAEVGCAYGRQLPQEGAGFFGRIARLHNYGTESYVRSLADAKAHGLKTCFISNSYAAYRREAMEAVGGFPVNTILSEDMCVAAKMLLGGWKIAYAADACVYHSHDYTIGQEFKRYFDIGVFHAREHWIRDTFGQAEGEGMRFVQRELQEIFHANPLLLLEMIVRDGMKFLGYRLGLQERWIPLWLKRHISMMKRYWESE